MTFSSRWFALVLAFGFAIGLGIATGLSAQGQTRRYVNLPNRAVQAPFSDAVLVGDTLYLAGRIGLDPKTNKPPAQVDQEVRNLLDQFKTVLGEAKMTMDDLVYVQVFCPDLSLYGAFNEVYRTYFGRDLPARAFVGSGPLLLGGRFEMQAIAVRR